MMKHNRILMIGTGLVLILVLGAGGFTAAQLLRGDNPFDDIPAGAAVYEDVFDDGSGNPVTVKTVILPAAELPERPAEASGIFLEEKDGSYFVGTGSVSVNIQIVNGEPATAVDHSGPELEVVIGPDTQIYEDITEFDINLAESTEQRLQQELRQLNVMPETIPAGGNFAAWGERRGDRVVAEVVVFAEPK